MLGALLASVHTIFPDSATYFIPSAAGLSIIFAVWLWARVSAVRVAPATHTRSENGREYLLEEEQRGEDEVYLGAYRTDHSTAFCSTQGLSKSQILCCGGFCRSCRRLQISRMLLLKEQTASCSQNTSTWLSLWCALLQIMILHVPGC